MVRVKTEVEPGRIDYSKKEQTIIKETKGTGKTLSTTFCNLCHYSRVHDVIDRCQNVTFNIN